MQSAWYPRREREEPPADTAFILTTAAPDSLLPTILSRVVRVRVARLADSIVTAFAQLELGVTGQRELAQRVALADGRIGRLLAEGDGMVRGADAAARFVAAVEAGPVSRYGFALGLQPFQARGGFTDMLRSEEYTSELQSPVHLVCRLLLEKKKQTAWGRARFKKKLPINNTGLEL